MHHCFGKIILLKSPPTSSRLCHHVLYLNFTLKILPFLICIHSRNVFKCASVAPRSSKKFYANLPYYNAIWASVNWLPMYFVSSKNAKATCFWGLLGYSRDTLNLGTMAWRYEVMPTINSYSLPSLYLPLYQGRTLQIIFRTLGRLS